MTSLRIASSLQNRIQEHLAFLYGADKAGSIWDQLTALLAGFLRGNPTLPPAPALTERDTVLITYGDQFREYGPDETVSTPPLQTLHRVLVQTLDHPVSGVHILPFFPYSSDDGFSIVDYTQVDPALGSWADIRRLGGDVRLMFDAVINHVSRDSEWFQRFLRGDPAYADWFITFEMDADLDWIPLVTRPRALPLLTPVETASGDKLVWTTFSDDQIDLNYAHPPVLLKILEILLDYVKHGAEIIRLDAIAYLWKRPGTSCIHLEETHRIVKLLRCVLDAVAPGVLLITETNVPHAENVSYFGQPLPGSGTDEAQLVYQFPLPPLILHAFLTGGAGALTEWAAGLNVPPEATFFNFTASHDGIGVMPVRGLLSEDDVQALVDATLAHGGRVSYRTNPDGSQSVYELNISYFDALSDPAADEPLATQVARFIASQAIMLSLAGLPGIYVHSLLGSRSWVEGVMQTGNNRTINRAKLDSAVLERELADPASLRHRVFAAYRRLLRARASHPAFHPYAPQQVLCLHPSIFALLRTAPPGDGDPRGRVLCLHNVADQDQQIDCGASSWPLPPAPWRDLLTGQAVTPSAGQLSLPPYGLLWLTG